MLRRLIVRIRITQEGNCCWSSSPPALHLAGNVAEATMADGPASGELPSFFRGPSISAELLLVCSGLAEASTPAGGSRAHRTVIMAV